MLKHVTTLAAAGAIGLASTSANAASLSVSSEPMLAYAILIGAGAIVLLLGLSAFSHRGR